VWFPILACFSYILLILRQISCSLGCDPLVILKGLFVFLRVLSNLPTRDEVVDLDYLSRGTARSLMYNLVVDRWRTEARLFLVQWYALASSRTRTTLLAYSLLIMVICSRRSGGNIDWSTLSSSWLTRSSTTSVAVFAMRCYVTLHGTALQLRDHLFSVHFWDLLHELAHHWFVLHYLSYIYDLAFLQVV